MERAGFLSYHEAEYSAVPPMTLLGSLAHYDREEVVLQVKRQAERLLLLRTRGWDSYGARPVNPEALDRAVRFVLHLVDYELAPPRLSPLNDGGVRLEWFGAVGEVWIDIPASGEASCFFEDERNGDEWEGPIDEAPPQMLELLTAMP